MIMPLEDHLEISTMESCHVGIYMNLDRQWQSYYPKHKTVFRAYESFLW